LTKSAWGLRNYHASHGGPVRARAYSLSDSRQRRQQHKQPGIFVASKKTSTRFAAAFIGLPAWRAIACSS
jgi:hypothetical protein